MSENLALRKKLTSIIIEKGGMDKVEGVGDIKKIFDNNEFPPGTDCTSILFGKEKPSGWLYKILAHAKVLGEPEPFAIADYGYPEDEDGVSHVGIITPDLKFVSKWGISGHVFESLPTEVPSWWGPVVYRRIKDYSVFKNMHPKLKEYLDKLGWSEHIGPQSRLVK